MKFMSSSATALLIVLGVLSHNVQVAESKTYGFLDHDYGTKKSVDATKKSKDVVHTEVSRTFSYEGVDYEYHVVTADGRQKYLLMGIDTEDTTKCYIIRDDGSVWADLESDVYRPVMKTQIHGNIAKGNYKKNYQIFIRIQDRKSVEDCKNRDVYEMDYYPPLRMHQRETPIFEDEGVQVWSKFTYQDLQFEEHYVIDKKVRLLIGINNLERRCYYIKNEKILYKKLDSPATRKTAMETVYKAMKNPKMGTPKNDGVYMFNLSGFEDNRAASICGNYVTYRFDEF